MMLQDALFIAVGGLIALILIGVGFMWLGKAWFIQWLKGTAGMILLVCGFILVYVLIDLTTYQQSVPEQPVVTVTVARIEGQLYDVALVDPEGLAQSYAVRGDQWQLDVRMLVWKGPFELLGSSPVYRLDRLLGRFLSLEQERTAERTVHGLAESDWVDTWEFLKNRGLWLDANYGSAVFMPLEDGAVYSVFVTSKSVIARPVNDAARRAVGSDW